MHLGGELETRLKEVKQRIPTDIAGHKKGTSGLSDDSTTTMMTSRSSTKFEDDMSSIPGEIGPISSREPRRDEEDNGSYSLKNVKKIDIYSRKLFPILYAVFVLYFFIRYHAIEGDLSFTE